MSDNVIIEAGQEATLETIGEEIRNFFKMENQSVFEIGKRLLHVKTKDLAHGKFTEWVTSIGIDKHEASKYIKAQKKLSKLDICTTLSKRILFELLSVENAEEFVNQNHTIPSTNEVKKIENMTVAELKEVKRGNREPERKKDYLITVSQRLKNLIMPLKQIMNDDNLSAMVQIGGLTKELQEEWSFELISLMSKIKNESEITAFISEKCNTVRQGYTLIELDDEEDVITAIDSLERLAG